MTFSLLAAEHFYWYREYGKCSICEAFTRRLSQRVLEVSLFLDWEGDGDLDIFFTTFAFGNQQAAWLENNGSQQFTHHLVTDTIANPLLHCRPLILMDDNDNDILLSSSDTDELYWLKNDGLGNFNVDTIGNFVNQFEIADLNGDNDWDIIFGRAYTGFTISEVRAFQNDGNNNFSMVVLKSGFSVIHEVIVEDINGDNNFDILVPDYNGDKIVWLKNNGSYNFSNQSNIITNFDGPQGISLKDVNGDGKKDIISGSYNDDEIYYFQGIGNVNTFSFSSGSLIYSNLDAISDLVIGNFDNQNNMDFVHTDKWLDEMSIWTNNGSQVFTQDRIAFSFDSPRAFDMNDLDGDGDQDLAVVSNDGDMVAWMENTGNDVFKTHVLLTNYEEPYVVRINDLDDDGDFDIVAASNDDDRVTWWKNDGSGNFTMTHVSTNLNGPRDLWIEDFDQDGDKDIAVMCYWLYNKIGYTGAQWLKNDGNENFTRFEIDDDARSGRSMRGGHMNNDTLIDLVMSSYYYTGSKLRIAVNNGNGFSISTIGDLLCEDFEICDYDGDQDNDILAIDFSLDSLYFYENTGNLQFTRHTIAYMEDLYGIAPRDFDGDGDMDIIFSTGFSGFTNSSHFEWGLFRKDSTGALSTEIWYQNLGMTKPMEVFDYEMDGDYDVVIGYDYHDKVTMYKNLDLNCPLSVDVIAGGATSFCEGDSVLLQAVSSDSSISYQWFRNNISIAGATSDQIIADSSGFYRVEITDTLCTSTSGSIQVVASSGTLEDLYLSFCENDSLILDTLVIKTPGNYPFNYLSQTGCDSTVVYHVSMNTTDSTNISAVICDNETYLFNGNYLSTSGTYYQTLLNSENCDSLITLNLQVLPTYNQVQNIQICNGDSIFLPGGYWTDQSGVYIDSLTSMPGCDSIWTSNIQMLSVLSTSSSYSICQGDSLLIHGEFKTVSGSYTDTLLTSEGCDSISTISLAVLQQTSGSLSLEICQGDSVHAGGSWQKNPGIFLDTLQGANTCDSLLTTSLTVHPVKSSGIQTGICQGDSIFLAGSWQKNPGNYLDVLTTQFGCDSLLTTSLSVYPVKTTNAQLSICLGDSAFLGGDWQKLPGVFTDYFQTMYQCDSVVTTVLNVSIVDTSVTRSAFTLSAQAAGASFRWLDCDQGYSVIPGETNAAYSPNQNGSYSVEVTQNGCTDTSRCFLISGIGIIEYSPNDRITLFPNPATGKVRLESRNAQLDEIIGLSIISATGSVLISKEIKTTQGDIAEILDLSLFPNGMYQVKIVSGRTEINKSLILSR